MSLFRLSTADYDERFDPHRFMAFREGMYDSFDSRFIRSLRALERQGIYRINTRERRPDVYSRDIYGTTAYWFILLEYNSIVSVNSLVIGTTLNYPRKADLESLYFSLTEIRR